jgi:beta-glucosidase
VRPLYRNFPSRAYADLQSFESFSEDPYLSGILASAYISGLQAGGIGATIKHFWWVILLDWETTTTPRPALVTIRSANDKEDERFSYDSIVSDRALREIYMMPFMLAQKYAQPWAIMTACVPSPSRLTTRASPTPLVISYNRLNGIHVAENPNMLLDIVRKEWGFDGVFMSDWFGTYSLDVGINAGVDLEMPGVNKWRTLDLTKRCLVARKVSVRTIKERALQVLKVVQKCAREAPEVGSIDQGFHAD